MLRRVGETVDSKDAVVKIKDASFPTPFVSALEYNSPVHGNWNIVHTGMQVPESIQIYVCADNCMRGVVLTAAEMNAADRFSFVLVEEQNLLNGLKMAISGEARFAAGSTVTIAMTVRIFLTESLSVKDRPTSCAMINNARSAMIKSCFRLK